MSPGSRQPDTQIGQLIAQGMRRQGIPSWHKLEELCEVSHGYLAHLIDGHIQKPKEETLRRLAYVLGQRVEEYRAVLLADRHELPMPIYYFTAHLGESVDERATELVMQLLEELVKRNKRES